MKISLFGFCVAGLLVNCFIAKAQYAHDYSGRVYMEQSYTNVEGSPYLTTNWFAGKVNLANGKTIATTLKYDLMKGELLFRKSGDSTALVFVDPVKSFSFDVFRIEESDLVPLVFSNGYPAIDNQTAASFYQVIADGKARLLRYYKKVIRTDQAFNSATVTKTFVLNDFYYVLINDKITRIKPGSKVILNALSDKAEKMQAYIKSTKVDYKSDTDLAKLFNYYNSL